MPSVRPNIAALAGYAPGEQPQGGKFIKLNTNENPYPPSPRIQGAIEAALPTLARYPDPQATAFRLRAAELFQVEPEWILCGNGSDDILTIVTRAFVGEGDWLRLPYPSYILYQTLADLQGARAEAVRFADDWSLPPAFTAPRERLRLAFLPNPNSPTGTVLPPADVLHVARQLPCPLLLDEAYADFADTNCARLPTEYEGVLVSRTLSKSYALAGLRFGFLIARPAIIAQLVKVKDSYNCDSLSIAAATAALDDQAWLAENRRRIIDTRQRLTQQLAQLGFSVIPSQANFVWCQSAAAPARMLYEQLKTHGILVRYMNYAGWGDGLRISVGTDDQIDALLSVLAALV